MASAAAISGRVRWLSNRPGVSADSATTPAVSQHDRDAQSARLAMSFGQSVHLAKVFLFQGGLGRFAEQCCAGREVERRLLDIEIVQPVLSLQPEQPQQQACQEDIRWKHLPKKRSSLHNATYP